MKFLQFSITDEGKWISGKESLQGNSSAVRERISASILHELQTCDVVIPMDQDPAGCLQGFLEMLGIPYVGSGPREIWLCQEIELLRELLVDKGIRALSSHLSLAGGNPKGDYYEFLIREAQDVPVLAAYKYCSSTQTEQFRQDALTSPLIAQGKEFSKRIFRALGCKRGVLMRLLLDTQNRFWFDRILPIRGKELLTFIQNEHGANSSGKMGDDLILYALQASRFNQRQS